MPHARQVRQRPTEATHELQTYFRARSRYEIREGRIETAFVIAREFGAYLEGLHVPLYDLDSNTRERHFAIAATGGLAPEETVAGIRDAIAQGEEERNRVEAQSREFFEQMVGDAGAEMRDQPAPTNLPTTS